MNPSPSNPRPITDEVMLALIEGELPSEESARVLARLRHERPDVAATVESMRGDRARLMSLGDDRAPADMIDRVQAALERDALVGINDGLRLAGTPRDPEVVVRSHRRPLSRFAGPLMVAAGIAIVASVGVYWAGVLKSPARNPSPIEPGPVLALNDAKLAPLEVSEPTDAPTVFAAAPVADAAARVMSISIEPERALNLAQAGRLIIKVIPHADPTVALDQLASGGAPRSWGLSAGVPTEWASVLGDGSPVERAISTPGWPWVKGEGPEPIRYTLRLAASVESLEDARRSLAEELSGKAEVVLAELGSGELPQPRVDTGSILWWNQPVSAWAPKMRVPVVIEPR